MEKVVVCMIKLKKWVRFLTILKSMYFVAAMVLCISAQFTAAQNASLLGGTRLEELDLPKPFDSIDYCNLKNQSCQAAPVENSFVVDVVRNIYIVKFDGYYDTQDRLHYLAEALELSAVNSSHWSVLPHTGYANVCHSDFDVLEVTQHVKLKVSLMNQFCTVKSSRLIIACLPNGCY